LIVINKWVVLLASGFVVGQALAQQAPWPAPSMPYVPFWVVPAPTQPVPPQFLLPKNVPFPMPFWLWYAPPPGAVPFPQALPAPGVAKAEAKSEAKAEVPPEVVPAPAQPEKAVLPPEPVISQAVAPPGPSTEAPEATLVEQVAESLPKTEPKAKVQASSVPVRHAVARTASKPQSAPAKAVVTTPKSTPVKKASAQPGSSASKPKAAKKTRKLCWKDGRLDVCE
jgi:hypothetical protein